MIARYDDLQQANSALQRRCEAAEARATEAETQCDQLRAQLEAATQAAERAANKAEVCNSYYHSRF